MIVALTGANGHVGNNLCRALLNNGIKVRALINHNDSSLRGLDLIKIDGSVTDKHSLVGLIKGADYVFHLAAIISIGDVDKKKLFSVNVGGTKNVVELCRQFSVKRLIHFSSIHALASGQDMSVDEKSPLAGSDASFYDQSKAEAERIVLKAAADGLNAVILNPTAVFGPNDFIPSLIGEMFIKVAKNRLPFIVAGGYNWVDVRDVAQAAISAMSKGSSAERYILSGEWKSLKFVAGLVAKLAKSRKSIVVPLLLARIALPFIYFYSYFSGKKALFTGEALNIVSREGENIVCDKAKKELGFENRRTVSESVVDTYNWFVNNKYLS